MIDRQIDIQTSDGLCSTFITHPERDGPHPVIIFLMDAPAIREELRDMSRRLATVGYYVMLPNLYYRSGEMEIGPLSPDPDSPFRKKMTELMSSLSIPLVLSDVDAMIEFAEKDPAAKSDSIGTLGYCMSGRYALCAAADYPGRIKATASIYGVQLVTDKDDSPHLVAKNSPAEFYIACAETDHWVPPEMIARIRKDLADTHGEVEIYPGTQHGFGFPQRAAYDKTAAERHWERLFALYGRQLG